MTSLKIVAVALMASISMAGCSLVPAIRYTQVAPPSVLPFSAQVSTFTRNLHVFDAPYAAGVIPGPPAIVQRALLPAPVAPLAPAPFVPTPLAPPPFAPAPFLPRAAAVFPGPFYPFQGRSLHALGPALAPAIAPAPLLG